MALETYAILSGKGGTGKTTLAATFVALSERVVAVDCDVDAANMALLLPGEDAEEIPFFAGQRASIDQEACTACGSCFDACRFEAISEEAGPTYRIDTLRCEGCKVCGLVCPSNAITFTDNQAGVHTTRALDHGAAGDKILVHGHLGVAQDNSGKLVAKLREIAKGRALDEGIERVVVDGPPGIGCPVHASLSEVSRALLITEPTPSGAHDLGRILEVLATFEIPAAVVINKHDLSDEGTASIRRLAKERGAEIVGTIPFDPRIPRLLANGRIPLGPEAGAVGTALEEIVARFLELD